MEEQFLVLASVDWRLLTPNLSGMKVGTLQQDSW